MDCRATPQAGLDALEVYHTDHDELTTAHYLGIAKTLRLGVSGGSDYHADDAHGGGGPGRVSLPQQALRRAASPACRQTRERIVGAIGDAPRRTDVLQILGTATAVPQASAGDPATVGPRPCGPLQLGERFVEQDSSRRERIGQRTEEIALQVARHDDQLETAAAAEADSSGRRTRRAATRPWRRGRA